MKLLNQINPASELFLGLRFLPLPLEYYRTLLVSKLVLQKNLVFLEVSTLSAQENEVHEWSWPSKDTNRKQGLAMVSLKLYGQSKGEVSALGSNFVMPDAWILKRAVTREISQFKKLFTIILITYNSRR